MPNNLNVIDKIKRLTVKLKLTIVIEKETRIEIGTGIIVNDNQKFYILTVEHVLFGKKNNYKSTIEDIEIIDFNEVPIIPIGIKRFDKLVLIEISMISFSLPDVVYLDKAHYDKKYHLNGYPKAISNGKSFPFNDVICNASEDNIMLLTINNLTADSSGDHIKEKINGLSGSGVFFEEYNNLYLVGSINNLIDKDGIFNAVEALTLVPLYKNKFIFTKYKTITDITNEMKNQNQKISLEELEKFKDDDNENFENLNRKNKNLYHIEEVMKKNKIRIKQYSNGEVAINQLSDLDTKFKDRWLILTDTMLDNIEIKYSKYIETKNIGQNRINEITKDIEESINNEFKYLLSNRTLLLNKLVQYIIAKWLFDCNIDFKEG
ncbi:MAG: hypothetical protein COA66_04225 [Arcobacter sp.]|nr:MAG: hypothetical protein COA66_04225 [Arcobacter sp.]